jgi:hypothetical protein
MMPRVTTKQSHAKSRLRPLKAPMVFGFQVFAEHLNNVINDLTFREVVINTSKVLLDPTIQNDISRSLGIEKYLAIKSWLGSTVRDSQSDLYGMETFLGRLRAGFTINALGLKPRTALLQFTGLAHTVGELGLKRALAGFKTVFGSPLMSRGDRFGKMVDAINVIKGKSLFMESRKRAFDRDIFDNATSVVKKIFPKGKNKFTRNAGALMDFIRGHSFDMIIYSQYFVDLVTWEGAYQKAKIEDGLSEERAVLYADQIVRQTQSGGHKSELAPIMQTNNELMKMFTSFYTYFSAMYNYDIHKWNQAKRAWRGGDRFEAAVKAGFILGRYALMSWLVPTILETGLDILTGKGGDDDDEDTGWAVTKYFGGKLLSYAASRIPFVRDFITPLQYDIPPTTPVSSVITTVSDTVKASAGVVGSDYYFGDYNSASKPVVKGALQIGGYVAAFPTRPIINVIDGYWSPSYRWQKMDSEFYKAFAVFMR